MVCLLFGCVSQMCCSGFECSLTHCMSKVWILRVAAYKVWRVMDYKI